MALPLYDLINNINKQLKNICCKIEQGGSSSTNIYNSDGATFPVQISETNVTQNTSGAASGKFLKIKVDGVDYVIELKDPS